MGRKWKRFVAMALTFIICMNFTMVAEVSAAADRKEVRSTEISGRKDTLSVEGNGSVGNLLAEPLEEEFKKQEENNGSNIFSIKIEGTTAYVEFETTDTAELVVAVYDENGVEMIASGDILVHTGDKSAVVEIETDSMPQYFYLRGFLIAPESLRAVCTSYESPNYTKDMQDFLASTINDYDAERVLNFDDTENTNFAVYADGTILLDTDNPDFNQITVLDETKQTYCIESADAAALSLAVGDVFSCILADSTVLIVKVGEVAVDGTTVTVTGQEDLDVEEVFSYVKIEEDLGMEGVQVDDSTCDEGVIYNGLVNVDSVQSVDKIMPYVGGSETQTKAMDYTFADKQIGSDDAKVSLNGSLKLTFDNTFEYYLTLSNAYLSVKMDYKGMLAINMSGHVSSSVTVAKLTFTALGVINIVLTPEILFEANAKLDITGKIYGTVGFSCSVQEGMRNLTTSPKFEAGLTAEADIYVGLRLRPSINLVSDKIAEVSMEATVGGQVKGKMMMTTVSSNEIQHDCVACVDGDVFGKYSLSFQAKLLNQDWLTYTYDVVDESVKVMDFYYSISKNEFGFTSCPHIRYLVTVTVKDTAGAPVSSALVNDSNVTNVAGQASLWMANGNQNLIVSKGGYSVIRDITVSESAQSVVMTLSGQTDSEVEFDGTNRGEIQQLSLGFCHSGVLMKDGGLYLWGHGASGQLGNGMTVDCSRPVRIDDDNRVGYLWNNAVEKVLLGAYHSAAITKDGNLYLWGNNSSGQLGDGTRTDRNLPVKVMENVSEVSLGRSHSAAITKDGNLYLWGNNSSGQLGDGTKTDRSLPVKVMENVSEISLGSSHSAAITKDGSLYLWGNNKYGALGDGTETDRSSPVKVMENVSETSLGDCHSAAITKGGSLYMWGGGGQGQLGDGTIKSKLRPQNIAQNIARIELGFQHSAAITRDGSLYLWGNNGYGQVGDGTNTNRKVPVKVMENVSDVSLGEFHSAAVTADGKLYLWGYNDHGQLGNGTNTNTSIPTQLIINTDGSPSLHALEEQEEYPILYRSIASSSVRSESIGIKTVTYTDLRPNANYMFYSMKYRGDSHPLTASNLLYLAQTQTDETGSFTLSYTPDEDYVTPTEFVVDMTQTDIGKAQLIVSAMYYTGIEQYINPLLIYEEKRLIEGIDYRISGAYRAGQVGEYRVMVTGIGAFTGKRTVTYQVEKKDCKTLAVNPIEPIRFDGRAIMPELVVKNGDVTLKQEKDYTVNYQNNKGAGIGIAEILGKGNYEGNQIILFDILPCALEDTMLTPIPEQEYTGKPLMPELVLKHGETMLIPGIDYQTEYLNNVETGTAEVTITGTGSYTGNLTAQFTIIPEKSGEGEGENPGGSDKTDCWNLNVEEIEPLTYTGHALTPEPVVKDKGTVLKKDKDYAVSYRSNTNAGTGVVIISGKGSYEGNQIILFDILPCALEDTMVTSIPEQEYTGKPLTPELALKHGETMLIPGIDYQTEYSNNVETGTAEVTITGTGSYTGSLTAQFTIIPEKSGEGEGENPGGSDKTDCRNLNVEEIEPLTYTGHALTPEPVVKDKGTVLKKDKDYAISYRSNTNAGTGVVIISGKGSYEGNQIILFDILPCVLKTSMLSELPEQKYSGKALTPRPVLKNEGVALMLGMDYRLNYVNNVEVGTAIVTVTGTGNYTGMISTHFKILENKNSENTQKTPMTPKKVKISSLNVSGKRKLTVKWQKVKGVAGYEIHCSQRKNFKTNLKKMIVKKGSVTKTTVKKLVPKKQYYVRVRAYKISKKKGRNIKIYGKWSKTVRSGKIK